ncbi:MAG: tRNA pseudouridine(55) synthase TruB [Candidatus Saccharimonadales bacterium]
MDGILLVDKPLDWTSHDVVAKVRSIIKTGTAQKIKIGHTGTLDPAATGLLVLVLGSYTKKASDFSKLDKTYEAELTLGQESTTGDNEGEKRKISGKQPTLGEIEEVLKRFTGKIKQTPPVYSAIKVDGQRAYRLARQGKQIKLESREVSIYKVSDITYDYPRLGFTARVSSGTYIRSLAEDIGQSLGTGAYLSALRRTKVGQLSLKDAQNLSELSLNTIAAL